MATRAHCERDGGAEGGTCGDNVLFREWRTEGKAYQTAVRLGERWYKAPTTALPPWSVRDRDGERIRMRCARRHAHHTMGSATQ